MAYRIFISHSSQDREWVEEIRAQVSDLGIEVYIYEHDPQPGTMLATKLQKAIRHSNAVVAVLTKRGAASAYVQQEIGFAINAGKLVIPLVQKGTPRKALALLEGTEYIVFDPDDREAAVSKLTAFLHKKSVRRQKEDELILAVVAVALILLIATE